jgi:hypothetical protein
MKEILLSLQKEMERAHVGMEKKTDIIAPTQTKGQSKLGDF